MYNGVCVFDIDGTLTCDHLTCPTDKIDKMLDSIAYCRQKNMAIAVNTARPPQAEPLHSIDPRIKEQVSDAPIFMRPSGPTSVSEHKLQNMHSIAAHFNVDVKKTILVDDVASNCERLHAQNIPCVLVRDAVGIGDQEYQQLKATVDLVIN